MTTVGADSYYFSLEIFDIFIFRELSEVYTLICVFFDGFQSNYFYNIFFQKSTKNHQ